MSDRRASRRGFFSGLPKRQTLEELGLRHLGSPPKPGGLVPRGTGLLHATRSAMACEFTVYLRLEGWAGKSQHQAADAAMAALDLIEREELRLSVYKPFSDVSQVNRFAAKRAFAVEQPLFDLLAQAQSLAEATDGAFDITAGPLIRAWGFFRRQGQFPSEADLTTARSHVGYRFITLDAEERTVAFDHEGIEINLGAIGKGYALDVALSALTGAGATDVLIQGGNSSLIARGDQVAPRIPEPAQASRPEGSGDLEPNLQPPAPVESSPRSGWIVGVKHPLRPDRRLGEIRLLDEAAGTSGGGSQSFFHEGRRYPHILDPRTGRPVERMISVTVIAPDAATADAVSTAAFVLGPDAAAAFLAPRPELGALMISERPTGGGAVVTVLGRMADAWTQTEPL